jgi:hypothetical protein
MIGVKQYVLRYWESEFEQLRPKKSKNNQRIYSPRRRNCLDDPQAFIRGSFFDRGRALGPAAAQARG